MGQGRGDAGYVGQGQETILKTAKRKAAIVVDGALWAGGVDWLDWAW